MARPNRYARAVHIVFALALVFGLAAAALVPSHNTPTVGAQFGATATEYDGVISLYFERGVTNMTSEWSQTKVHDDSWAVHLNLPEAYKNAEGAEVAHMEIWGPDPADGVKEFTLDLDMITEWTFWEYWDAGGTDQFPAYAEIKLDKDGDGIWEGAATDYSIIFEPQTPFPTKDTWVQRDVHDATQFQGWDFNNPGLGYHPLSWWQAQADYQDCHVLAIHAGVGWGLYGDYDGYIDDFKLAWTPDGGTTEYEDTYRVEPVVTLSPDIAYNVKGAEQTFTLSHNLFDDSVSPYDQWASPSGLGSDVDYLDWTVISGVCTPSVVTTAGGDGYDYITIQSSEPGDCHVTVQVEPEGPTVDAEKKWGKLSSSILDVDASTTAVDHEKWISRTGDEEISETLKDTVYANFYWGECTSETLEEHVAAGAWVHWWLMVDTTDNQEAIDDIMDMLEPAHGTWCGCGGFGPGETDPFETIWDLAVLQHATDTEWNAASRHDPPASRPVDPLYDPATDGYYYTFTTSGTDGTTTATLVNSAVEDVLIVVYVEYPLDYHGQNPVCVEMGKKHFGVPPPVVQVKVPQVRWAGEKIVLEKDWSTAYYGKVASFQLEHPGVGTLEVAAGSGGEGFGYGELVYTIIGEDGIARCILNSEEPGQADVKAVLYDETWNAVFGSQTPSYPTNPISEHAFVVFFLKLEEVTPLDPTPVPLALGVDADFGIQVKGWFTSSDLSTRAALDVDFDGDGVDDATLPAGRWVMPDDWPILAGADPMELRPHWDLMNDWANNDDITSTNKLGPFDGEVQTVPAPDGPGEAEYPTIGPFSTLQEFSDLGMWISEASVPADSTISGRLRNTVVPDGEIDLYDCPMPQAKVIFRLTGDTIFIEKMKTAVSDYLVDSAYEGPYYEVEIPANSLIPPLTVSPEGYSWDSWGFDATADGPYEFWDDLAESTATTVLEVYTDNNGRAYVTVDGLSAAGTVSVTATADYPYLRKHPAMKCEAVTLTWEASTGGPVSDTIDLLSGVNLVQWWQPYGDQELPEALTNIGPEGLDVVSVLWHRDTISGAWLWFDPELPGASPLQILDAVAVPDTKVYVVVVTTGCTWELP